MNILGFKSTFSPAMLAVAGLALLSQPPAAAAADLPSGYPEFCADGTSAHCDVIPNQLGPLGLDYIGLSASQAVIDNFSWQMLVALMWPLDSNGQPAAGLSNTGPDTKRYWETLRSIGDLFHAADDGPACNQANGRVFQYGRTSKSDILRQVFQKSVNEGTTAALGTVLQSASREVPANLQATGQAVTDINGNYVIYDVRLNSIEADYVTSNNLTTIAGQRAFAAANASKVATALDLPLATDTTVGAIEVKLAWRILTGADDQDRFIQHATTLAIPANQLIPSERAANPDGVCLPVTLGLVGMHVMSKPEGDIDSNEWLWSTFEHVDNAPMAADAVQPFDGLTLVTSRPSCSAIDTSSYDPNTRYSFYNPECSENGGACKINEAIGSSPFLWKTDAMPYTPSGNLVGGQYGSQVARCYQIYDPTQNMNAAWQAELAKDSTDPLQNYMVVGSQWAATVQRYAPQTQAWDISGVPNSFTTLLAPVFLTNTTMETFIQTSDFGSCMLCHFGASVPTGDLHNPGLLGEAQDLVTNRSFIFLEAWGEF